MFIDKCDQRIRDCIYNDNTGIIDDTSTIGFMEYSPVKEIKNYLFKLDTLNFVCELIAILQYDRVIPAKLACCIGNKVEVITNAQPIHYIISGIFNCDNSIKKIYIYTQEYDDIIICYKLKIYCSNIDFTKNIISQISDINIKNKCANDNCFEISLQNGESIIITNCMVEKT